MASSARWNSLRRRQASTLSPARAAAACTAALGALRPPRAAGTTPAREARRHVERAAHEVAEIVREVGVDARDQRLLAEARVEAEDHLAQQEVAEGIEAVAIAHRQRRDHVAETFRHLARVDVPVAVDVQMAVGGQPERPQHRRPEDRVRLQDVLADEVLGARPERGELRRVGVADPAEIVDAARRTTRSRRSPRSKGSSMPHSRRDFGREMQRSPSPAGVAQHAERLVAVALGADEVRVLLDLLREPAEVAAHLEEVVRLAATLGRALVVAAQPVLHVALGEEALATDAVEALVLAEVDLPLVPEPLQHGAARCARDPGRWCG